MRKNKWERIADKEFASMSQDYQADWQDLRERVSS